ncbi:glutamate racemase [Synechococcus sp. RSCCF101]|uniref:glutamate racemase n=1 Tax=Synechococcus sp. RSCCF101 TaxID=2511069 RepID=UPI001245ADD2|nr:glutamate racemase [Synechococcus sp. RSCCF101]QEY31462.1 glutamate racemase [Synechococcus sp. RSCCF101]
MNGLRIGLFDSGVGGLTVLRRLLERHPGQPCLYLADSARVPYGGRSPLQIRSIAAEVISWLIEQRIDAVVMACNTTNALAYDVATSVANVPVYGLIDSVARTIRWQRVGVLATAATARSGAYADQIRRYRPHAQVHEQGCPQFVPMIEAGRLEDPMLRREAQRYLSPLLASRVEAVLLGCTHYPLLEPLLCELLPDSVALVDPAQALTERLDSLLGRPEVPLHLSTRPRPLDLSGCRFCVTGSPEAFARAAEPWLGTRPMVESVTLRAEARAS